MVKLLSTSPKKTGFCNYIVCRRWGQTNLLKLVKLWQSQDLNLYVYRKLNPTKPPKKQCYSLMHFSKKKRSSQVFMPYISILNTILIAISQSCISINSFWWWRFPSSIPKSWLQERGLIVMSQKIGQHNCLA